MDLAKAFDPQALIAALEAKSLVDAKKIVTADVLPVIFDWLNSSVAIEAKSIPLLIIAQPILSTLEEKVLAEVNAAFGLAPA